MNDKKPYTTPQIVRVELNHKQAILTVCSTAATNLMTGGAATGCRVGNCKNGGLASADNAARVS